MISRSGCNGARLVWSTRRLREAPRVAALPLGDDYFSRRRILHTSPDRLPCPADKGQPATYRNNETHWWDGSQIYGSNPEVLRAVRTDPATGQVRADGKLQLDERGHLPLDQRPDNDIANLELAGVNGNWWIGLSIMHTLFAREHNTIVDRLRGDYPHADGEWLFQKARLVNAALIAKIHTVEWTPALMNSPEGHGDARQLWGLAGGITPTPTADRQRICPAFRSPTDHRAHARHDRGVHRRYRMHSLCRTSFLPPPQGRRR